MGKPRTAGYIRMNDYLDAVPQLQARLSEPHRKQFTTVQDIIFAKKKGTRSLRLQ